MEGGAGGLWDVVYEIARADDLEEFRAAVLCGARRLIPADLAGYTEVDLASHEIISPLDPPVDARESIAALGRLAHQHPLITQSDGHAETISDYLSVRAYHALELYTDVYRPVGAEDQLAITVDRPGSTVIGVALNRSRRCFTQHERDLLDLLRPQIVRGHHRVLACKRGRLRLEQLSAGADAGRTGVIALTRDGAVAFLSDRAREWLPAYFQCGHSAGLPEPLADWVASRPPEELGQMTVAGSRGRLELTLLPTRAGEPRLIEVRERPMHSMLDALTAREREVLERLAAGESNQDIAEAFEVSRRTVEHHLQSIYRKLEVTNRTAAAAALTKHRAGDR